MTDSTAAHTVHVLVRQREYSHIYIDTDIWSLGGRWHLTYRCLLTFSRVGGCTYGGDSSTIIVTITCQSSVIKERLQSTYISVHQPWPISDPPISSWRLRRAWTLWANMKWTNIYSIYEAVTLCSFFVPTAIFSSVRAVMGCANSDSMLPLECLYCMYSSGVANLILLSDCHVIGQYCCCALCSLSEWI